MIHTTDLRYLAASFSAALSLAIISSAQDWPTYRANPARSAHTTASLGLPLKAQWQYQATHAPSPAWPNVSRLAYDAVFEPVIADGKVFFGSSTDDCLRALDLNTGQLLWNFVTDGPIRFAPAVDGKRVFVTSDDGRLYCLDRDDGSLLWQHLGGPDGRRVLGNERIISRWPARGGAVTDNNIVYYAAGIWPTDGIYVYALDMETGAIIWQNDKSGSIEMGQPHGGATAESGVAAQGHLVLTDTLVLVPTGRSVPAAFDRASGAFVYFHLQKNGHTGGSQTMASGKHFFNNGVFFDAKSGTRKGRTGGTAIAGIPDGIVTTSQAGVTQFRWREVLDKKSKQRRRKLMPEFTVEGLFVDRCIIATDQHLIAGGKDRVSIIDTETQKECWTARVEGTVGSLAMIRDQLIVSTDQGRIYSFATTPGTAVADAETSSPETLSAERIAAAKAILLQTETEAGYTVILGSGDGMLARALAEQSQLRIICIEADRKLVDSSRQMLANAGLLGQRVHVICNDPQQPILPRGFADLVLAFGKASPKQKQKAANRLRRPYGGIACTGTANKFTMAKRGAPKGAGDWTHQYADAANTVCSDDSVRGPLGMLWWKDVDQALTQRHGRGPSPLFFQGRIFSLGLDSLLAVDAYNGRELWRAPFPDILKALDGDHLMGTSGTHSPYCVSPDGVYVRTGSECVRIDLKTGRELGRFPAPKAAAPKTSASKANWGYLAVHDGVLFGSITDPSHVVTFRYLNSGDMQGQLTESSQIFAMNAKTGTILWQYIAKDSIRHNAIAIGGDKLYLIDRPQSLFDRDKKLKKGTHPLGTLLCLDCKTGVESWRNQKEIYGTVLALSVPTQTLLMSYQPTRFRLASELGGRMSAFDSSSGVTLWDQKANYQSRPLINRDRVLAQGGAWDLRTGKAQDFPFSRSYGCGILAGGRNLMVFRSAVLGTYDLETNEGTEDFGGMRPGCWINAIPAGGLVLVPDGTAGCVCSYQNRSWVALQAEELAPPEASPSARDSSRALAIKLSQRDGEGEIRYTTDGSDPTKRSKRYSTAIRLAKSATIRARAFGSDVMPSRIMEAEYVIDRQLIPLEDRQWKIWDASLGTIHGAPSTWTVSGGVVHQASNIFTGVAKVADEALLPHYGTLRAYQGRAIKADGRISCEMQSADNDGFGIAFRYSDPSHHYLLHFDRERKFRVLARRDGDSYTLLARDAVAYESSKWFGVEIVLDGSRIRVLVDGAQIFDVRDTKFARGSIALHSWGSQGVRFRRIRFR